MNNAKSRTEPLAGDVIALHGPGIGLALNPVQTSYANYLSKGIAKACDATHGGQLLVEAETGVGKTIAYLSAIGLRSVLHGERAVVSTYTIALQRQIIDHDAVRAFDLVERATGKRPSIAVAVGLSNYVDADRVVSTATARRAMTEYASEYEDLDSMLAWAKSHHGARIDAFLEETGMDVLPAGIQQTDICIDAMTARESPAYIAYQADLGKQQKADIIVTNHALLASIASNVRDDGLPFMASEAHLTFGALVIDEADRMRDACMGRASRVFPLTKVETILEILAELNVASEMCHDAIDALTTLRSQIQPLEEIADVRRAGDSIVFWDDIDESDSSELRRSVSKVARLLHRIAKSPLTQDGSDEARLLRDLRDFSSRLVYLLKCMLKARGKDVAPGDHDVIATLDEVTGGNAGGHEEPGKARSRWMNSILAIRWTPTRKDPSFLVFKLYPERLLKALWSDDVKVNVNKDDGAETEEVRYKAPFKALVLTSATLADGTGADNGMINITMGFGIYEKANPLQDVMVGGANRFAPKTFGSANIVFSSGKAPSVFLRESQYDDESARMALTLNPAWIAYTVAAVRHASSMGGRGLVLTTSYRATAAIASALRAAGVSVIEQERNQSAEPNLARLAKQDGAFLVSPRAWEGVDMGSYRDPDGARVQLKHVVMSQLPFPSMDEPFQRALEARLRERGLPDKTISAALHFVTRGAVFRRIRQAFGRGIRGPHDAFTFWICDCRMPRSDLAHGFEPCGIRRYSYLAEAIPRRFRIGIDSAWEHGALLSRSGNLVNADTMEQIIDGFDFISA